MSKFRSVVLVFCALAISVTAGKGADAYKLDPAHSSVTFMIEHMGISYVHGRFNEVDANLTIDKDVPSNCSFAATIKTNSVDTAVKQRDDHLRSPDFFNVKQFPLITFQSTAVKAVKDGYEVTGDLAMHGVKKAITFTLHGGKTISQKGSTKIGFYGDLELSRKDFGVGNFPPPMLGDAVKIYIGLEAFKK